MSFGDDKTGAAWRKGLKVGDAVEVELSVGFRNLNFFRGTLANITPTGRFRVQLTDIIRIRRDKLVADPKGLKTLSTDDLTRLAGALQLALCVSEPDREKPKASELFCPTCLDLLEVIDEELPPEPTTTSPENSP